MFPKIFLNVFIFVIVVHLHTFSQSATYNKTADSLKADFFLTKATDAISENISQSLTFRDSAIYYCYKTNDSLLLANTYFYFATDLYTVGYFRHASIMLDSTAKYYTLLNDSASLAKTYYYSALNLKYWGHYKEATKVCQKAVDLYTALNDNAMVAFCTNVFAYIYDAWGMYSKSKEYSWQSVQMFQKTEYYTGYAYAILAFSTAIIAEGYIDSALVYQTEALKIFKEQEDLFGEANAHKYLGNYFLVHNYQPFKAEEHLMLSLSIYEDIGNLRGIEGLNTLLGKYYAKQNNFQKAIFHFQIALNIAQAIEIQEDIIKIYKELSNAFAATSNYKEALEMYKMYSTLKDSVFTQEQQNQMLELQTKFDTEKKEAENALLKEKDTKNQIIIKQQATQNLALVVGLIFLFTIAFLFFRSKQRQKKANELLREKNKQIEIQKQDIEIQANKLEKANFEITAQKEELQKQNTIIKVKNQHITDSINYAGRIQSALMPEKMIFENIFPESFIYYQPRDIVSGDFYWFKVTKNLILIAAADCTGHGVPGAFVSMLGIAFLNEIINSKEKNNSAITPAIVLEELRELVKTSLKQNAESKQKDGMDIALCMIDLNLTNKHYNAQFAGANNSMYVVRNKTISLPDIFISEDTKTEENDVHRLFQIPADKNPIGIHLKEKPFNNHSFKLFPNDALYFFSDGYADQIGGNENRKFMSKNFKKLLLQIQKYNFQEQKEILRITHNEWIKDNVPQVDDILVIGLKL